MNQKLPKNWFPEILLKFLLVTKCLLTFVWTSPSSLESQYQSSRTCFSVELISLLAKLV
ncbi:UNVERIFIED_CONTAM: hypothetical protein GTU68_010946 [Idotea baltica]|nr:hypothetical protein [Idotea baltica]